MWKKGNRENAKSQSFLLNDLISHDGDEENLKNFLSFPQS